jgi:flagellar operon protein
MVNRVSLQSGAGLAENRMQNGAQRASAASFASLLTSRMQESREVKFSAHALQRMRERGVTISTSEKAQITQALNEAESKGARETLLLMDGKALVASVPNRTIITVVSETGIENTVFTNIDSAVLVGNAKSACQV